MNGKKTASQTEADFIATCLLPDESDAKRVALAVREAIATLGGISHDLVLAHSSFEDLDWTPFWKRCGDAGFETEIFISELESRLSQKFTKHQLEQIRDPDLNVTMTIAEFISDVRLALGPAK